MRFRLCMLLAVAMLAAACSNKPAAPAAEPGAGLPLPAPSDLKPALTPGAGQTWFQLGKQLRDAGRCEEAEEAFAQAVAQKPDDAEAHRMYGFCLMDAGRDKEAVAHLEVPANLDSKDPEVWARLARLYRKQGNYDTALACAMKAQQIAPDSATLGRMLGRAGLDAGKYQEAIRAYTKVLEKGEKAWVRNNLGLAYLESGEPEKAHAEFLRAVFLSPKNATFHNNLGVSYQRLDRLDEAQREFAQAVKLDPNYTRARFNLQKADLSLERMQATGEGDNGKD